MKLLRAKYGRITLQTMHGDKIQFKLKLINNEIQLVRDVCKRRSMDIEGTESIIETWELIEGNVEHKVQVIAEPI
jgi:hypothetical protein